MNKLILSLAILAAPLSACTANQVLNSAPVIGNVCEAARGTLIDDKAVLAANVFYNVPAHAYFTANEAKQINPALKASLKPKLIKLFSLLQSVKAAKGTVNCDFNAMKQLSAEVTALLPKGK